MNASTLQSFIARNASVITSLDADAGQRKDRANWLKAEHEMSLYFDEIAALKKVRKALRKAHTVQVGLIGELKAEHARASAISTIIRHGYAAVVRTGHTLAELQELAAEAVRATVQKEEAAKAA